MTKKIKIIAKIQNKIQFALAGMTLMFAFGTVAHASIEPTPYFVGFGSETVGSTSESHKVSVTNGNTYGITISSVSASAAQFSYSGPTLPVYLNPGESLAVSVTFRPFAAQFYSGGLQFTQSNGSSISVGMDGTGQLPAACISSSGNWANDALSQTAKGSFRVTFDALPSAAAINGTMGLSMGSASVPANLAAIVRFNDAGNIDARNSRAYRAASKIPYLAGTKYHFILDVNATTHTYDAYVMIGSVQTTIGSNFAFNYGQGNASSLNNLGTVDTVGSISVCNAALSLSTASTTAPVITTEPVSKTVVAGNTASFTVTATGTAPLRYQWNKNGVAISEATSSVYTTPAETTTDNNATFTVAVSNSAGSVASNAATLTVSAATHILNSSASSLSFGNINVSGDSIKTATLTNAGNSNVTISNVTISGAGFNTSGVSSGLILAPGQTTALTATFAPSGPGSVTGKISVASNATNSPDSIALSGTGVTAINHSVGLSWSPSTSTVTGYNTYSSTQSGGPYTKLTGTPVPSTSYTDSTVQGGKIYYFVVTSVDSSNMESPYSSEVSALVP
jgi:hypothetical protein